MGLGSRLFRLTLAAVSVSMFVGASTETRAQSTSVSSGPCVTGGPNVILGTDGDDDLVGTNGHDIICGLGGNDKLRGGNGDDLRAIGRHRPWWRTWSGPTGSSRFAGG